MPKINQILGGIIRQNFKAEERIKSENNAKSKMPCLLAS